jgi:hypothetical protein
MLVTVKAYRKVTKNGKEVILPLLESVLNNKTYFINRGFSITLNIPDEEIARLVKDGVLWDSTQKDNTTTTTENKKGKRTKTEPTDIDGF